MDKHEVLRPDLWTGRQESLHDHANGGFDGQDALIHQSVVDPANARFHSNQRLIETMEGPDVLHCQTR